MPIFSYFAVVGAALVGLLFYADANLAPRGPLAVTTDFVGLPQPWHGPVNPSLAAAPAPAPDMTSDAVLAAAPKPATNGKVATIGMATSDQAGRVERAPKKKRQIVRRAPPQWHEQPPRYAWRGDPGPFGGGQFGGGGGMFGRF